MVPRNIVERVVEVIDTHRRAGDDPVSAELEALATRLAAPVRVAVVGRVKAGKSTIVNALLRQAVAPTDVSECTKLVTWFQYGNPQRVVADLEGGGSVELQLTRAGTLPAELSVGRGRAVAVRVYLANETLRSMTLIDTPGIGSVHDDLSMSTRELLAARRDTSAAAATADAVVLVLNAAMLKDDLDVLASFRAAGPLRSGANVVGVLSRADQLEDPSGDPWGSAMRLAGRLAQQLRSDLATVVPVIGLLAETAETARLTEPDARNLTALAGLPQPELERLTWSTDRFLAADLPLSGESRSRLLARLDLFGLNRSAQLVREGVIGAGALRRSLSELSAIAEARRVLVTELDERGQLFKVASVLRALHALSFRPAEDGDGRLAALRGDVEDVFLDPAMHEIAELEAAHELEAGGLAIDDDLVAEAGRLFARSGREHLTTDRSMAEDGMRRWRTVLATTTAPRVAAVARVVLRSYELLCEDAA
jgi:hypothetical protein